MIDHITVVIVTKNEQQNITACLDSLKRFDDVCIVDSHSSDRTCDIANTYGNVRVVNYEWNGRYPKKRQWCLDTIYLRDWVLFIDADERMTDTVFEEIKSIDLDHADGYFIKGRYVINNRVLKFGMQNAKLCLFNRHLYHFPVVDDLDVPEMGEIEGHYQPAANNHNTKTKVLKNAVLHAADNGWTQRHEGYAKWQAAMNKRRNNPKDARIIKQLWLYVPFKSFIAFMHSYILKRGFLDGREGFIHASNRAKYYAMIANASKDLEP